MIKTYNINNTYNNNVQFQICYFIIIQKLLLVKQNINE